MKTEQNLFPLMIDLSGRKIVIIGAGNVGASCAMYLASSQILHGSLQKTLQLQVISHLCWI